MHDYIIATEKHKVLEGYENDHDMILFLDMDVSILGADVDGLVFCFIDFSL